MNKNKEKFKRRYRYNRKNKSNPVKTITTEKEWKSSDNDFEKSWKSVAEVELKNDSSDVVGVGEDVINNFNTKSDAEENTANIDEDNDKSKEYDLGINELNAIMNTVRPINEIKKRLDRVYK